MTGKRVTGVAVALWLLAVWTAPPALAVDPGAPATGELGLRDAVVQTLEANLDLAAQRRTLAAQREEIGIARSDLLPLVELGARAQHLDADRSDDERGNTTQDSVSVAGRVTQVVYDEQAWSGFTIQKHVYASQEARYDDFRLGVVQDTASTFLELDRARSVLDIQNRNRELTVQNLETSRARIAAGWSSEREVLRWQTQLANNDTDIVRARVRGVTGQFALNRVRNRPAEELITVRATTLEEYGFVYAREGIVEALRDPAADRRMRDLLVREGLARSPELRALDAALAAEERLMTANRRAFWVPSVSLGARIDHLAASSSGSSDFNETEWKLVAGLTFPLVQGGAKLARLRQTGESLGSLRIQRRATVQSLDQRIRAAFAVSTGAYQAIAFARAQQAAARRNYELVAESYQLGVASLLGLLDAQNQLLAAEQAVIAAVFAFLEAVVAAEREMALFPFLEPEAEMTELLDRIERGVAVAP